MNNDPNSQGYNVGQNVYGNGGQTGQNGVYWRGTDGNVWVKGSQGVNSAGRYDSNTDKYWFDRGYYQIQTPNSVLGEGTSTSTDSPIRVNGGSGNAAEAALYDQAIQQAQAGIGTLDQQRQVGVDNVTGDYTNNLNRLLNAKNTTQQKYEGNVANTRVDNTKARSNVDFETGQRANALQRLLGSKGAGFSSASRVAAPYAAALEGTQQLNQVGDAFKENMGNLDESWNTYQTEWTGKKGELDEQKENQLLNVERDVNSKRQSLLLKISELAAQRQQALNASPGATVAAAQPYLNQVNQLAAEATNLGANYFGKVNVADPTYQAPDLSKYDYNQRSQIGTAQNAQQQTVSPYLSVLLGNKDRKQNQVV